MKKYKIILSSFNANDLQFNAERRVYLYADFNVLNYFYESRITVPDDVIMYHDSTAVYIALYLIGKRNHTKQVSTDILDSTLKKFNRIFFFGSSDYTLSNLRISVVGQNGLSTVGTQNGFLFDTDEVIKKINEEEYDILYVGLGLKRQEEWILKNYSRIKSRFILSSGGWFEYASGIKKRAPLFVRKFHLEWLYKLIKEFKRVWKRYLIGFPLFTYRILTNRIVIEIK